MGSDPEILCNYKSDTIYIALQKDQNKRVTFVEDLDFFLQISPRVKFVIQGFYAQKKGDFATIAFIKLKLEKGKWVKEGEISFSSFDFSKLREFLHILNGLNLTKIGKSKLSLNEDLDVSSLIAILQTEKGKLALEQLASQPTLLQDIPALAHKKEQLEIFRKLLFEFKTYKDQYVSDYQLVRKGEENIWQDFFERNTWIFGLGLNYHFLHKVDHKLEATAIGYSFNSHGHRLDALMRTKAIISQFVCIEIKTPSSDLIKNSSHRAGCWPASNDLTEAVSQIQKAVFDFVKKEAEKIERKEEDGCNTGDWVYNIYPKSYLVIGNLSQLKNCDEKFISFQLYRDSLKSPEIITYDELFERAKCIINTITPK